MRTAISGIGLCGGFGTGIEAFRKALETGERAKGTVTVRSEEGPFQGPAYLADTGPLDRFVERKALRRLDHFSKLALLAACLAYEDAGDPAWDRSKTGLVVASGYGPLTTTFAFLDSFIESGDKFSSPTPFSHSVHNAALAQVSMRLGITGPGLTVSQFEMSVPSALLTAWTWLEEGRVDSLLFGAVDEYNEVLGYCWHRLFGPWGDDLKPLDFQRQTAVPGEGAVFFLLADAEKIDRPPYAYVERVRLGRGPYEPASLPQEACLVLGADGHKGCGSYYRPLLGRSYPVLCGTPSYGSFPAGAAFDVAAAALMLKEGKITAPCWHSGTVSKGCPLEGRPLCCLKMGPDGEWGEILLTPWKGKDD